MTPVRYLPRTLATTLRRTLRTFPAVLVSGARQSGKTTLLLAELEKTHAYVSLDRPDVRDRALADPVGFLDEAGSPLILDEIQQCPDLLPYVKERIDQDRRPGRWVLTGSQSLALMRGASETLAGRIAVLTLDTFSTAEAAERPVRGDLSTLLRRIFGPRKPAVRSGEIDLADWLLRGSFPEPRAQAAVDRRLWYASYVQTYLERDVRALEQVGDLETFRQFLFLAATRTGQLVNMSEMAREIGVTGPTIKRWMSVLTATGLVHLLRPYHRNYGKRIRKQAKLHFLDPGLATFLLGLHTPESVLGGPSLGPLAETAVASEWIKAARSRGETPGLWFWQSTTTAQVDLIVEHDGRLHGIEVKATSTPTPRHAAGLARWLELAGTDARGVLACRVPEPMTLGPRIRAVPWDCAG